MLLDKIDVLLIDAKDHFDYICTAPRALIKEKFIEELVIPFQDVANSFGNKFEFMHGVMDRVNTNNTIEV